MADRDRHDLTDEEPRERRRAARVDGRGVSVAHGIPIEILNLSPTGMLFRSKVVMAVGDQHEVSLDLTGEGSPAALTYVVIRRDSPETERYRAVFVEPDLALTRALEHYVSLRLLVDDVPALTERYPSLAGTHLHVITDASRIDTMLRSIRKRRQPLMVAGGDQRVSMQVFIRDVRAGENSLHVGARDAHLLMAGDTLLLNLQGEDRSLYMESAVIEAGDRWFRVLRPKLVFYTDKRVENRRTIREGSITAVLPLPYPSDAVMRLRVLDLSPGGIALEFPQDRYLLPGTPVDQLQLVSDDEKVPPEVGPLTVRHVSAHPEGLTGLVRVGMQFSVMRRSLEIGRSGSWDSDDPDLPSRASITADPPSDSSLDPEAAVRPDGPNAVRSKLVEWFNDQDERIVARLDTPPGLDPACPVPVVLIPPAATRTKESVLGLAHTLVRGFASVGHEVAVLRFDGIRRRGESHRDGEPRPIGQQMLAWRHSQGIADMRAAARFVRQCKYVRPSHVLLVTFRGAALEARRWLTDDPEAGIDVWIPALAVPEFAEASRRVYGGLDVVELASLNLLPRRLRAMGEDLDAGPYVDDAVRNRLHGMDHAERDMAHISCPVHWVHGLHDGWVDRRQVNDLMTVEPDHPVERLVYPVETGHNLRGSRQALDIFHLITTIALHAVKPGAPVPQDTPTSAEVERATRRELERVDELVPRDMVGYWRGYLLGSEGEVGFDIMCEAEDYDRFMRQQVDLLGVEGGQVVADLGTGTGNLADVLAHTVNPDDLPARLVLADLVPQALEVAGAKVRKRLADRSLSCEVETRIANLEFNRFEVIRAFLDGELHGIAALAGRISGFGEGQLERLAEGYDTLTHEVMRGHRPGAGELERLRRRHDPDVLARVLEFSRAARLTRGPAGGDDRESRDVPPFRFLDFGVSPPGEVPPLADGEFDRIASSLTLCYLNEPARVVAELWRYLRPGGRIVLSTPRPDMDISLIFTRLVGRLQAREGVDTAALLDSARSFSNDAALLLSMEERGLFHLPDGDDLVQMFRDAGFVDVGLEHGLGDPPQALVVHANKPA